MFLNRLKLSEKESFLMLAHHIAHADGSFSGEESLIIEKYCMEMQMDDINYQESDFNLHDVLSKFEVESHKKIALLELMALVYADGRLATQEETLIAAIIDYFDLNPMLAIVYREWSKSIMSLFIQGEALINL